MGVKQWVRAMLVLSAMPSAVLALGLGEIRLNSTLNSPLDAEIELVNASAEELDSLRAQLASRETFARYGLEWPSFLQSVTLTRGKSRDGRDVLRVKSNESITEPFVTLLVDANWGRGRLVREYTMLLDPPVFAPAAPQAAQAPVAAPATSASRSGTVERAPAAAPAPSASTGSDADSYRVRRGDTLSEIAARVSPGDATREQAMVSLYRANPSAFEGSMNDLRAGAVLRVPQGGEWTAESASSASAEVRRQGAIWRGRAPSSASTAAPSGEGRLRLVAPTEPAAAGSAGTDAAARREIESLRSRLGELETELSNSKRLLELRNSELAELQRKLASATGAAAPAAAPAVEAPAAEAPAADVPAATPPVAADGSATAEPAAPADASPAAAAEPAAVEEKKPAKPKREKREKKEADSPGMLSGLLDLLGQYWYVLAGLVVAVAAFFGYKKWQAGRDAALDDTFVNVDAAAVGEMTQPVQPVRVPTGDTTKLRRPNISNEDRSGLVVEESGEYQQPRIDAAAARSAPTVSAEDTFSGETGINLDQGDPLAEADFHMAYGLYDQAADLVRLAVAREPERRDLKLKLAEVFFVWGNKDEFLKTAQELRGSTDQGAAGEWDKLVIMGKQIAPEDPMFSGASMRSAADGSVDLRLEQGSGSIDFDVFGDGSGPTTVSPTATSTDFDLGSADLGATLADSEATGERLSFDPAPTVENATVKMDAGGGTTREMAPQFATKSTDQSLDFDLGADLGDDVGEAPTVEQPALRGGSPTIRAKLDAALRQTPAAEQTAEIALDDLGLDLQGTGNFDQGDFPAEDSASPDAPTLLANLDATGIDLGEDLGGLTDLDDTSRRMIDEATKKTEILPRAASYDTGATAAMEQLPDDLAGRARDSGATSMMAALDMKKFESSLDLSSIEDTGTHQSGGGALDLDVGSSTMPGSRMPNVAVDGPGNDDDLTLPSLEPVTISEVGTKLDLARAYMDMGDPDGARSILREVLQEGSVSQKQEAERLMSSLPG